MFSGVRKEEDSKVDHITKSVKETVKVWEMLKVVRGNLLARGDALGS